jgi:hypothetical protein
MTEELSEHEQAMMDVFAKHGPLLSHADVRRHCRDAGLNDTTTAIYLTNSPILRRVEVGVYSLIGATVSPGAIDAISKANRCSRAGTVIVDYGWNPKGPSVWAMYRLSAGMLRNGVISAPAGIKKYLTAESYELRGPDGAHIGRLGVGDNNMWGFIPFFRRRGGDVGDYMRVDFELATGIVRAELSDEPPDEGGAREMTRKLAVVSDRTAAG